jgi:hypothetical protein
MVDGAGARVLAKCGAAGDRVPNGAAGRTDALADIGIKAAGTVAAGPDELNRLSTAANTFIKFKGRR